MILRMALATTLIVSGVTASDAAAETVDIMILAETRSAPSESVPCSQRYRPVFALRLDPADRGKAPLQTLANFPIRHAWGVSQNLRVASGDRGSPDVLQARYPEGSYNPGAKGVPLGGAGFQLPVLTRSAVAAACLAYAVRFPVNFDFRKGGKLPGLYGGVAPSGCRTYGEDDGFSLRYMWRAHGAGELYAYLPDRSERCGASISRGAWTFPTGRWLRLEQEAVLNHVGREDGTIRVWVDGRLVVSRAGLVFRRSDRIGVAGLMFSTFFGGSDPTWASPRAQTVEFAAFRIYERD